MIHASVTISDELQFLNNMHAAMLDPSPDPVIAINSVGSANTLYMLDETMRTSNDYRNVYPGTFLIISNVTLLRGQTADAKEELRALINENVDLEYQQLLSAALSPRNMTVIFKHIPTGIYHAITTSGKYYQIYLGCMMLANNTDADFVRRAADAIAKNIVLTPTTSELQKITRREKLKVIDKAVEAALKLLNPMEYQRTIDSLRTRISELESALIDARTKMMDTTAKAFYAATNLDKDEAMLEELKDYLLNTDGIEKIVRNTTQTFIVAKAYLRIPEEDKDFFKDKAIESPNHLLHAKPNLTALFKDIFDNKVRFPVYATYTLQLVDSGMSITGSTGNLPSSLYGYTDVYTRFFNKHINGFNCFTGYKNMIHDMYVRRDLIGMFETMIQCTASISVFDTTVMREHVSMFAKIPSTYTLQYYEDNQWNNITLEEYYEKVKART